jgi:uncharacterized protein YecE (DUF72 family)
VDARGGQLSLFEPEPPTKDRDDAVDLASVHADAAAVAARLPPGVHFGTSSWSFPGWRGIVYQRDATTAALARDGLRQYAAHPLLTTVGVDRSYYAPVPAEDLRRYADQLPDGFRACLKAPASVTSSAIFDPGARTRSIPNPAFMSPDRLVEELVEPCARWFAAHTGPFVLEFPPSPRSAPVPARAFLKRLDALLDALPREFEYAVEVREPALLTREYAGILARHGAGHVYNYWSFMPMPVEQARVVPPDDAPFTLVRLLLKPGTRYEDRRESFRPFDRIVEPDDGMRLQVATLVRRAAANRKRAYVLVNNKAEGSAPLTIRAIAEMVAGQAVSRQG